MCDDCLQHILNVDLALGEILSSVLKKKWIWLYKAEFESALRQSENKIKQLLRAIEEIWGEVEK